MKMCVRIHESVPVTSNRGIWSAVVWVSVLLLSNW